MLTISLPFVVVFAYASLQFDGCNASVDIALSDVDLQHLTTSSVPWIKFTKSGRRSLVPVITVSDKGSRYGLALKADEFGERVRDGEIETSKIIEVFGKSDLGSFPEIEQYKLSSPGRLPALRVSRIEEEQFDSDECFVFGLSDDGKQATVERPHFVEDGLCSRNVDDARLDTSAFCLEKQSAMKELKLVHVVCQNEKHDWTLIGMRVGTSGDFGLYANTVQVFASIGSQCDGCVMKSDVEIPTVDLPHLSTSSVPWIKLIKHSDSYCPVAVVQLDGVSFGFADAYCGHIKDSSIQKDGHRKLAHLKYREKLSLDGYPELSQYRLVNEKLQSLGSIRDGDFVFEPSDCFVFGVSRSGEEVYVRKPKFMTDDHCVKVVGDVRLKSDAFCLGEYPEMTKMLLTHVACRDGEYWRMIGMRVGTSGEYGIYASFPNVLF